MAELRGTLEIRYLITLAAVGREGSFSRAADALGYTQSAVSQQIARLERLVGRTLVERPGGSRPVTLTAAGAIVIGHADAIVARLASVQADLSALAQGAVGTLRVGCYQSVGVRILPRVLREFAAAWPQVKVEPTEAEDDGELLHLVESGDLDLTFIAYPMMPGPFTHLELLDDPYVVVVKEDSDVGRGRRPGAAARPRRPAAGDLRPDARGALDREPVRPTRAHGPDRVPIQRQRHDPRPCGGRCRRGRHLLVRAQSRPRNLATLRNLTTGLIRQAGRNEIAATILQAEYDNDLLTALTRLTPAP